MEEDPDFELGEEKSIVLRVPKPAPPPQGECETISIFAYVKYLCILCGMHLIPISFT